MRIIDSVDMDHVNDGIQFRVQEDLIRRVIFEYVKIKGVKIKDLRLRNGEIRIRLLLKKPKGEVLLLVKISEVVVRYHLVRLRLRIEGIKFIKGNQSLRLLSGTSKILTVIVAIMKNIRIKDFVISSEKNNIILESDKLMERMIAKNIKKTSFLREVCFEDIINFSLVSVSRNGIVLKWLFEDDVESMR